MTPSPGTVFIMNIKNNSAIHGMGETIVFVLDKNLIGYLVLYQKSMFFQVLFKVFVIFEIYKRFSSCMML